ncbi:MAG TPA: hypothetical protein VN923_16620, partial [Thermoanaerobaculia bacterium]|nr:hypothetical protein [Thermoanaerobaculia bacterium]
WDQWSMGPVWTAHYAGQPVLPLLLAPYNGHRNVLPRMFFYGLGRLTHWDLRAEVVANYLAGATSLALLLAMARRRHGLARWLAVPLAAQVFSLLQYENFISGYPFGQDLSQLLATLVVFLLTLPTVGTVAFAGAALAAVGATFSWGAGLATLPVGLVAMLLRGERRPARLGVWLALTAGAVAVVKASASGQFRPVPWSQLPQFYLALVGKAWSPLPMPPVTFCMALGAAALAAFAGLAVWAYRRVGTASLPWLVLGLQSLAAAGLIALGRAGEGFPQALASHYVTATYPLIVSCAALALLVVFSWAPADAASSRRSAAIAAAIVVVAGITLQPAIASAKMLPILRGWNSIVSRNALAIARGTATDEEIRVSHHPDPKLVREVTEVLRAHRLAWFRDALDGDSPAGNVDRLAGQPGGSPSFQLAADQPWTIEGWAVGGRDEGGPVRAVELFVDGRRCAQATLDLARQDVADYFHSQDFLDSGWMMTVPAGSCAGPGTHHVWLAAAEFDGGLFPLFERDVEIAAAPAPGAAAADRSAAPATP